MGVLNFRLDKLQQSHVRFNFSEARCHVVAWARRVSNCLSQDSTCCAEADRPRAWPRCTVKGPIEHDWKRNLDSAPQHPPLLPGAGSARHGDEGCRDIMAFAQHALFCIAAPVSDNPG
jgi:hypothetical protein